MSRAEALASELDALSSQPVDSHAEFLERLHTAIVEELQALEEARRSRSP
ncbi:MAG: hypothetical protein ACRDZO_02940 [Egibacteraceae bacterium]